MRARRTVIALVALAVLLLAPVSTSGAEPVPPREHGYITLPDGVRLKYTVLPPAADGPFVTGLWGFLPAAGAGPVTVHHDAAHPSSLVLGHVPGAAPVPLPACGTLAAQPCRTDPLGTATVTPILEILRSARP